FNMGQACAEAMIPRKSGVILNISSVAWLGNVGQTNYSASKAGVVGLTRTWAVELARHGIRVNAIAPGLIDSVLTRQVPEEIRQQFLSKIPLGRIGDTMEIAHAAAFLCSDHAAYVTGQILHVDGGLSVGI
ncbi:MAG: SDR family oxidoreductase, partial [Bdellovibrionales bacterium]|nr:SDR family oxidoreductase [Bdellovibrionales bacterium]